MKRKEEKVQRTAKPISHGFCTTLSMSMLIISLALLLFAPAELWAKQMNSGQAKKTVKGWLNTNPTPLGCPLGVQLGKVDTFADENGRPAYYVVYLQPAGFVIVPADDLVEPIIGFSAAGSYDPSDHNPLGALVSKDLPGRIAVVQARAAIPQRRRAAVKRASSKARAKWDRLQAYADSVGATGISGVSDVRVAPLLQSTWGQMDVCGYTCYNYYTPNNWPCGCVATSMAQLMRYHERPASYVWNNMPAAPPPISTGPKRNCWPRLATAMQSTDGTTITISAPV
jgi:hypothetical protein